MNHYTMWHTTSDRIMIKFSFLNNNMAFYVSMFGHHNLFFMQCQIVWRLHHVGVYHFFLKKKLETLIKMNNIIEEFILTDGLGIIFKITHRCDDY